MFLIARSNTNYYSIFNYEKFIETLKDALNFYVLIVLWKGILLNNLLDEIGFLNIAQLQNKLWENLKIKKYRFCLEAKPVLPLFIPYSEDKTQLCKLLLTWIFFPTEIFLIN